MTTSTQKKSFKRLLQNWDFFLVLDISRFSWFQQYQANSTQRIIFPRLEFQSFFHVVVVFWPVMSFNPTIQKMFNLVDTDRDGLLSLEEVVLLFRALGQSPTEREMTTAIGGLLNWHINFSKKKYNSQIPQVRLVLNSSVCYSRKTTAHHFTLMLSKRPWKYTTRPRQVKSSITGSDGWAQWRVPYWCTGVAGKAGGANCGNSSESSLPWKP